MAPTNADDSMNAETQPTQHVQEGDATADGEEPVVRVRNLEKRFSRADGTIVKAIDDVSIDIMPGEFVVLLGPSGCGKTTLLRSIGGLEFPDAGRIEVRGEQMFSSEHRLNVPPERRHISMIFQSYALWPHMTAFQNVAYPLKARREPKQTIEDRVQHVLELVGIPELTGQHPGQMSGGQQQRVALARAIVANDAIVLFDEPLSNVDAKVREQLRLELLSMQRELGFSALYVTHDQLEAMELAHRIAVMNEGRIEQLGTPREVYDHPVSRYVANFIGRANEVVGTVSAKSSGVWAIETPLGPISAGAAAPGVAVGDEVAAVFRPERCHLSLDEPAGPNRWRGLVEASLFVGPHMEHVIRVGDTIFQVTSDDDGELNTGTEAWVSVSPDNLRAVRTGDAVADDG
jgi:iron(III) transport system ATP-binding protein